METIRKICETHLIHSHCISGGPHGEGICYNKVDEPEPHLKSKWVGESD